MTPEKKSGFVSSLRAPIGALFLFNRDRDPLGHYWRIVWDMAPVAQNQLQRVFTGRQLNCGFGLPAAKVFVIVIGRDGFVEFFAFNRFIDNQMVMAGFFFFNTGRRHTHSGQAELDKDRAFDTVTVLQIDEIDLRTVRGWGFTGIGRNR